MSAWMRSAGERVQQVLAGLDPRRGGVSVLEAAGLVDQQQQVAGLLAGQAGAVAVDGAVVGFGAGDAGEQAGGGQSEQQRQDRRQQQESRQSGSHRGYNLPAHRAICQAPNAMPTALTASTAQYPLDSQAGAE